MKFSEFLTELLDSSVEIEKVKSSHSSEFIRKARIGKRDIIFNAAGFGKSFNLEFYEEEPGKPAKIWDRNFDITGSGNQFQVFAMLKQCVEELIHERNPSEITFSADKDDKNRANVYERLFRKFKLPHFTLERDDNISQSTVVFTLTKDSK